MASRYEAEVKLSSARNLKNVNWRNGPNRPYGVAWVDSKNKFSTKVDENGDTEAEWDQTLVIPLPPQPIEDLTLYIDIVHAGSEEDTKPLIGSAKLRLVEILDDAGIGERVSRSLTLKRPSGRPHGKVDVKVTIREPGYPAPGSYYTPPYGVPPPPAASRDYNYNPSAPEYRGYGAPQQNYGYSAAVPPGGYPYNAGPQTAGYGAQTASYGQGSNYGGQTASYGQGSNYGAEPASYGQGSNYGYGQEEKKKSKFGGMGTGLAVGAVAGVLGGVALVEGAEYLENKIADDAAEKVEDDLGYDDNDDDDGGYDGDDF
ncbi:uncharacterized protein LOC131622988 [Vicia villosa]|uniref:uncharacterized protein LOC131622988 n=1 Tax=Vicia villosa TaxID=3911 RepID=UPI00273BDC1E|nr:uncharacterized protein LOC131622988 [Vicia villosa]